MKKFIKTFILAICLILPCLFCLTACGGNKTAKISSFSVELANTSYTLIDDTITVTYGGDYRLSVNDFSVTATFDDETSKTLTANELEDLGFTFESNIPNSEKTPAGTYEISIKHEDVEESKTISLVVEKATISVPNMDYSNAMESFTYDGSSKTTKIKDEIKEQLESLNISTSLSGTLAETDAGEYQVTITFTYTGDDKACYNLGDEYLIGTKETTWEINPKKLTNLELYLTNFKYDNSTKNYVCEKTLSSANGVVSGDNVTLTIKACRTDIPANGIYELWYNKDMQGEVEIIACNNNNYIFENGSHGCGTAYVCDSFDIENGITAELPSTYYIIELELGANSSMKYRFNISTDSISFSLKDENLNAISYNDGFTLTNDTDSTKTFVVYMMVSGQGTITIYNHRAVLMNGESVYQTLNVVNGYDISNIVVAETYYTFNGWYTEANKEVTTITSDVILYANYTAITYKITYEDIKDVVNPNPTEYTIEDGEITLQPLPNRVDYTFVRWERDYGDYRVDISPTTVISVSTHKGNLTLKAIWDKKTEYDAFTYTVSEDCLEATITGLTNESSTNITIPKGVVAIGNEAFEDCTTLSTVQFEEGSQLLTIGDYAFSGCTSLSSITIPEKVTTIGNYAFERSGLRTMNFSENGNLTTLGNSVFFSCAGLTEFTIPDSVTSMGTNVFSSCIYLTKIVFGKGMTVIGEYVYGGSSVLREIEFKGEITSFHKNALKSIATQNITLTLNMNQKYLEQVALLAPNGGTDYTDDYRAESRYYRNVSTTSTFCGYDFSEICLSCDATEMTAKEFSSKLESGSNTAFTNLKFILPASADDYFSVIMDFISKYDNGSVTLTIDGATSIPANAFYQSMKGYRLKEVIIGDSVTSIGYRAFEYCKYIQKVTFGKGLTSLGKFAFRECSELTNIEIPNSVTSIGNNCFSDCIKLESVKLSASITVLNDGVFSGCTSLKNLIIPNGVTEIGFQALVGCTNLESIVIPDSVTNISIGATYSCKALTKVYYTGTASDWNNITIDGSNDPLNTATIYYYSESEPSTTGNYWHYVNDVPTAW